LRGDAGENGNEIEAADKDREADQEDGTSTEFVDE